MSTLRFRLVVLLHCDTVSLVNSDLLADKISCILILKHFVGNFMAYKY